MREFVHRPNEHWALVRRTDLPNHQLAIFLHGFRGNYLTTWGNLPEALVHRADAEAPFDAWDFLFLGYETSSITHLMAIAALVSSQWTDARDGAGPFRNSYDRLALFGHSLGTLGLRQLLCATSEQPDNFRDTLHSVSFFGSPLNGSPLAPFSKLTALLDLASGKPEAAVSGILPGSYAIKESMRPDGPQLLMLRTWNCSIRQHVPLPQIHVYQGTDDAVVGPATAFPMWAGDRRHVAALDHKQISKINEDIEWASSTFKDALVRGLR